MNPKTVLLFDHTARLGGGEVALLNLVKALDPHKYKPVVVLGSSGILRHRLMEAGIETHVIPLASEIADTRKESLHSLSSLRIGALLRMAGYCVRLARLIKAREVDLIHTNSLKADIIGAISARMAHKPVLWHVRDRIAKDYLPPLATRIFLFLCGCLPDYIVANSAATLATLGKCAEKKSCVVHDGIPAGEPSVEYAPCEPPVIGLIGRISPWKGQHIFIRAAGILHQKFPDARFQIIGSPLFGEDAYEMEIRGLVNELGLTEIVEFCGFRDDVQQAIRPMRIVVHASTLPEPFGQVIAEAMYLGKPVVATNGGGVPEIIEHNRSGLLIPMGDTVQMADAIERLLARPAEQQRLGRAARERILAHFTIEHTARKIEEIYESLLKGIAKS